MCVPGNLTASCITFYMRGLELDDRTKNVNFNSEGSLTNKLKSTCKQCYMLFWTIENRFETAILLRLWSFELGCSCFSYFDNFNYSGDHHPQVAMEENRLYVDMDILVSKLTYNETLLFSTCLKQLIYDDKNTHTNPI